MHHYIHLSQNSITKAINNLQEKKKFISLSNKRIQNGKITRIQKTVKSSNLN